MMKERNGWKRQAGVEKESILPNIGTLRGREAAIARRTRGILCILKEIENMNTKTASMESYKRLNWLFFVISNRGWVFSVFVNWGWIFLFVDIVVFLNVKFLGLLVAFCWVDYDVFWFFWLVLGSIEAVQQDIHYCYSLQPDENSDVINYQ